MTDPACGQAFQERGRVERIRLEEIEVHTIAVPDL